MVGTIEEAGDKEKASQAAAKPAPVRQREAAAA
jgi:hypothetical protein